MNLMGMVHIMIDLVQIEMIQQYMAHIAIALAALQTFRVRIARIVFAL